MEKYITKKVSETEIIDGFTKAESALFRENGFTDNGDILRNFYDLFVDSEPIGTVINERLTKLKLSDNFVKLINDNKDKKFCIIGDYDCDGIMATTIFKLTFDELKIKCSYIIPNRLNDGYGIKVEHVKKAIDDGAEIIITVDNGIAAIEAVEYAKSKNVKFIITDHHIPEEEKLPNAELVIDPHLSNDEFPDICGAVVALKLSLALLNSNEKSHMYRLIETISILAAIASIADMMPCLGENRELIKSSLQKLNELKENNIWNRAIKIISGFGNYEIIHNKKKIINEDTISFLVAPTINSQGRVYGDVECVVDAILKCDNPGEYINGFQAINKERKERSKSLINTYKSNNKPVNVVVLNDSDFEYPISGLTGLVSNRLTTEEHKPSFIGLFIDGCYKFSGRTVPGYSIYDAVQRIRQNHSDIIINGGGHDSAMGIELQTMDDVNKFSEYICEDFINNEKVEDRVIYDFEDDLRDEIVDAHKFLAPYGEKFKKLKFRYCGEVFNYNDRDNSIDVGLYNFKAFVSPRDLPEINSEVELFFTVVFDYENRYDFKLESWRYSE